MLVLFPRWQPAPHAEYNVRSQLDYERICKEPTLACPFFMPTRRSEDGAWLHPSRLPLGSGWQGRCTAPGYEGTLPSAQQLQEGCNLGYAVCPRLPQQRAWDAIRFAVSWEQESRICLSYVCERNQLPGENGELEFVVEDGEWVQPHSDPRIQRMAECFLDSWLQRMRPAPSTDSQSESIHE
jgi:hypothetical protein